LGTPEEKGNSRRQQSLQWSIPIVHAVFLNDGDVSLCCAVLNCRGGVPAKPLESKKIFVGGLAATVTEEAFRSYFEKYGRITDAVVMMDRTTQRSRGFGFVTYDQEVRGRSLERIIFVCLFAGRLL